VSAACAGPGNVVMAANVLITWGPWNLAEDG
jgi:hypothetical protein